MDTAVRVDRLEKQLGANASRPVLSGKLFLETHMGHRLELRDLRSLERRSMYSIFHPLDPNERLPRELILEAKRYRFLDRHVLLTWVGVLYLPALILTIVVLGSFNIGALFAFGTAGVALLGVYAYVTTAREP